MIKAAIFDFNGTLYYDRDINLEAWELFYEEFLGTKEGAKDFALLANTQNNRSNVLVMLKQKGVSATEEEIIELARHKEDFYHLLAIKNKRTKLAEGVEEVINYLQKQNIKLNLATASIKFNIDFYFEFTDLKKYFDKKLVAYDDGVCLNKVEMYKKAARELKVEPAECLVFDDSAKSIDDAIKAGYQKIVRINHYGDKAMDRKEIIKEIKNYDELDASFWNNLL